MMNQSSIFFCEPSLGGRRVPVRLWSSAGNYQSVMGAGMCVDPVVESVYAQ
ncbi:Uncharacterised protein [Pseudomonas fluorescens]|uniref:Uncharacterized protein n=1 Tax=Pseudomonas fluorescens TaxID=294 RepID=A0A379IG65_PSEFL|nr:Uncharacterised protein [Pseudomonas fluorescens]